RAPRVYTAVAMSAPRHVLIVNPQSQGGALGRRWPEVSRAIRRQLGSFEELRTEGPGDATRLARQAIDDGADRIVAIGGDGTINEVVNGFFDNGEPVETNAALGILPFGSGGDFRKTISVPKDIDAAAHRLANGQPRRIDVGHLEYTDHDGEKGQRMFVNIASFGVSGLVDRYVNESSKRLGGTLSFLLASARAGLNYSNKRVRLRFDDGEPIDLTVYLCAIANGRYFGGGMYVAPEADLADGKFDVVSVGDIGKAQMLLLGTRIYNGTHLTMDAVSQRRATRIHAEPIGSDEVLLDVDGETPGRLPATFRLIPQSLSLVVS
ncbi:MAG: diacylglycerol kinase family lipid kinase, partial [Deltaproteobacteria bacterium]|nr:diacylglycerol kinase family lipid kinase [Deltaproteobacteria bacterium]